MPKFYKTSVILRRSASRTSDIVHIGHAADCGAPHLIQLFISIFFPRPLCGRFFVDNPGLALQTICMAIKILIREVRHRQCLTLRQLEALTGIGRSTLSRYEAGQNYPTVDVLDMIADALGCSIADLYTKLQ